MKVFNTYFRKINNKKLIEIAKENNMTHSEMGTLLVNMAMEVYTRHGLRFNKESLKEGLDPVNEHTRLVDEYFRLKDKD